MEKQSVFKLLSKRYPAKLTHHKRFLERHLEQLSESINELNQNNGTPEQSKN